MFKKKKVTVRKEGALCQGARGRGPRTAKGEESVMRQKSGLASKNHVGVNGPDILLKRKKTCVGTAEGEEYLCMGGKCRTQGLYVKVRVWNQRIPKEESSQITGAVCAEGFGEHERYRVGENE